MPDTELKPCPFCGGSAALASWEFQTDDHASPPIKVEPGSHDCIYVGCAQCGASTYDEAGHVEHQSVEAAAKAWNTRATEDALRSRMAEVRAMLNACDAVPSGAITPCANGVSTITNGDLAKLRALLAEEAA